MYLYHMCIFYCIYATGTDMWMLQLMICQMLLLIKGTLTKVIYFISLIVCRFWQLFFLKKALYTTAEQVVKNPALINK